MRASLLCVLAAAAFGQVTENVFIVNIDGLRYTEGFGAGRTNMPFVWDSLRPRGAIYTELYNTGITVTNAGHSTITAGVRQLLQNNADTLLSPVRPREPSVAEYYRRYKGAPATAAVFVSGNPAWRYPVSTYPGFGDTWAPTIRQTKEDDLETWDSVQAVISRYHPKLCYVLFGEVDLAGHTGDTAYYIGAIRQADSLTWQLWTRLQADTIYRNRTTLILTTDHGRHDDAHGGWKNHGCSCRGCRHLIFLAVGPEIIADTMITVIHDQIDIAPTIGCLLGFPTPLAQGSAMTEMFMKHPPAVPQPQHWPADADVNVSRSPGLSRSADIIRTAAGLHVVFSDRTGGQYQVYYCRSTDGGSTWSVPKVIMPAASPSGCLEPVIAAVSDTLIVGCACLRWVPTETTFVWTLSTCRSTDAGVTWDTPLDIDTLTTVSCKPAITSIGRRVFIIANLDNQLKSYLSRDAGATFDSGAAVAVEGKYHPQWPSATTLDTSCYAVWQACNPDLAHPYHDIWFDCEPWHEEDVMLTHNDTLSFSYQPCMTRDVYGVLHVAYCHLPDAAAGNRWQINYIRSLDRGLTWSMPIKLNTIRVGYAPALRASIDGRVSCVWSVFSDPLRRINGARSTDIGRTWSAPEPISALSEFAVEPKLAVRSDTAFVVWEDNRDGNWEIYFAKKVLTGAGLAEESSTPHAVRPVLTVEPSLFRGFTVLRVAAGTPRSSSLAIYDASGRKIRTIALGCEPSGSPVVWDSRDDAGRPVPAGIYFVRLELPGAELTRCLVKLN